VKIQSDYFPLRKSCRSARIFSKTHINNRGRSQEIVDEKIPKLKDHEEIIHIIIFSS